MPAGNSRGRASGGSGHLWTDWLFIITWQTSPPTRSHQPQLGRAYRQDERYTLIPTHSPLPWGPSFKSMANYRLLTAKNIQMGNWKRILSSFFLIRALFQRWIFVIEGDWSDTWRILKIIPSVSWDKIFNKTHKKKWLPIKWHAAIDTADKTPSNSNYKTFHRFYN